MLRHFTKPRLFSFVICLTAFLGSSRQLWADDVRIHSPSPVRYEDFGYSVAADGGVAVVSMPLRDDPEDSGAFVALDGTLGLGWQAFGPFQSNQPMTSGRFGSTLAYQNGNLVVRGLDGIEYFTRDAMAPQNWIYRSEVTSPMSTLLFGLALAIDGTDLVAGDPFGLDPMGDPCGLAHVFHLDANNWIHDIALSPAETCPPNQDFFRLGFSVDISGDTIAAGNGAGIVYLFRRVGGQWEFETKIEPTPDADDDYVGFGFRVQVDGDRLLVASPGAIDGSFPGNRAYIYERSSPGTWTRVAVLTANIPTPATNHGIGIALKGDLAVVGSPDVRTNAAGFPGTNGLTFLYQRQSNGTWALGRRDAGIAGSKFGYSLALDGDHLWVGDYLETINFVSSYGAVYVIDVGPNLFADGFETGDSSAWSAAVP